MGVGQWQTTDTAQLNQALQQGQGTAQMAVALALWAGLTRQELQELTWDQVGNTSLHLPGRTVALCPELSALLQERSPTQDLVLPAMAPQSMSRLVKQWLMAQGVGHLSLADLRHGYILTQLSHRTWGSLCQELQPDETALRKAYGPYVTAQRSTAALPEQASMDQFFATQPPSLGVLAVFLAWQGIAPGQLPTLSWRDITALGGAGFLPQAPLETACVFASIAPPQLSRLARQALVQGGLEGITLQSLCHSQHRHQATLQQLLTQGSVSCKQVAQACALSNATAKRWLGQLTVQGQLVQVGMYYYPAEVVPPADTHRPLLLDHAARQGAIYPDDVARLLHLRPSQCRHLLATMAKDGTLSKQGSGYLVAGT